MPGRRKGTAEASRGVRNALTILETLGDPRAPLSLSEISRRSGVPKATAFRYLNALQETGYARSDIEGGGYSLGARVLQLHRLFYEQHAKLSLAREALPRLAETTGETSHLGVLHAPDVVYIDLAESPQHVRAYVTRGEPLPAYCVASGHAILAYSPPELVERVISAGLLKRTSTTITDRESFLAELAITKRRGYSITPGQWSEDVVGISAPIFRDVGEAVAAIGISCPLSRASRETVRHHVRAVCDCAQRISAMMNAHSAGTGRNSRGPASGPRAIPAE